MQHDVGVRRGVGPFGAAIAGDDQRAAAIIEAVADAAAIGVFGGGEGGDDKPIAFEHDDRLAWLRRWAPGLQAAVRTVKPARGVEPVGDALRIGRAIDGQNAILPRVLGGDIQFIEIGGLGEFSVRQQHGFKPAKRHAARIERGGGAGAGVDNEQTAGGCNGETRARRAAIGRNAAGAAHERAQGGGREQILIGGGDALLGIGFIGARQRVLPLGRLRANGPSRPDKTGQGDEHYRRCADRT